MMEPRGLGHLFPGRSQPSGELRLAFSTALPKTAGQFLLGRWGQEDQHRVRHSAPDDVRPLHVDLEHRISTCPQGVLQRRDRGPRAVAVDLGPFEESIAVDQLLESFFWDEEVLAAVDFTWRGRAGGARNREEEVRV